MKVGLEVRHVDDLDEAIVADVVEGVRVVPFQAGLDVVRHVIARVRGVGIISHRQIRGRGAVGGIRAEGPVHRARTGVGSFAHARSMQEDPERQKNEDSDTHRPFETAEPA